MNIATPAFFWLPSVWNTLFYSLTFSLYVSLDLKWVSCRQHVYKPCFCIHSTRLCLLVGTFKVYVCSSQWLNWEEYEASQWLSGKESSCDAGDVSLIPGLERSSGGGHGDPFQYSCLENPMDRGAWQATVHQVTQSWTRLKRLSTHHVYVLSAISLIVLDLFL